MGTSGGGGGHGSSGGIPSPSSANHMLPPGEGASDPPAGAQSEPIKVEKVDLTEEDDGSLDATLGYVAEYEGTGYAEQLDPSVAAMAETATASKYWWKGRDGVGVEVMWGLY